MKTNSLQYYRNTELIVGILSDSVSSLMNDSKMETAAMILSHVKANDSMGSEINFSARAGQNAISARITPKARPIDGDACSLELDLAKCVFSIKTIKRKYIRSRGNI
jgi:hypothetical protein